LPKILDHYIVICLKVLSVILNFLYSMFQRLAKFFVLCIQFVFEDIGNGVTIKANAAKANSSADIYKKTRTCSAFEQKLHDLGSAKPYAVWIFHKI